MMFPETKALVIDKLMDVYSFKLKSGNKLRGRCPSCNHKEASAWGHPDEPSDICRAPAGALQISMSKNFFPNYLKNGKNALNLRKKIHLKP